jgi:hypothetical protein
MIPKKIIAVLIAFGITAGASSQSSGYLNLTTLGILAGTSADDNPAPFSFVMEHNYRFKNRLAPGILTGFEQLNENVMPLALNLKYFLPARKCDFFLACLGGYSVSLEKPSYEGIQKAKGGFLAGTEMGFLIHVNSGSSVVLAIGYRYNELNYTLEDLWLGTYERKITYNRFSVRMGIALY